MNGETSIFCEIINKYQPSKDLVKPSEHILQACKSAGFPDALLDCMRDYGFGNYGKGIIKFIAPEDYMKGFYTWLGGQDFSKIPFMMTGFGDIFYFRNVGDGNYDISLLDIHHRKISVLAWSVEEFAAYLSDSETQRTLLRCDLFNQAIEKCGMLQSDEIYYFTPALIAGGAEDIKYVDKGKADVHHLVLFQLGLFA